MRTDKKSRGGRLRLVLARRIGAVETVLDVPENLIISTLEELTR
jgi:3-dehydroquinate synthetase